MNLEQRLAELEKRIEILKIVAELEKKAQPDIIKRLDRIAYWLQIICQYFLPKQSFQEVLKFLQEVESAQNRLGYIEQENEPLHDNHQL
ncbi:hypothetical protein Q3V94_00485 [Caloramator sp. CAR-1]|uniref:hypothetical protein n=1 Tax=Caloramator sp. CAR-1 TaxID=3062777 RepID=UPI0026E1E918|nr:hypothetical protein [Caloramator sp. CAR-1]MDO6353560.1 hypothetical protein [Caloramator sp. CAR-1]